MACLIPSPCKKAFIDLAMNRGSRSKMTLSGIPNLWKRLSIRSVAIPSEVTPFIVSISIIPFVRPWSTTDKIESKPFDLGKSVIRSIAIWVNGQLDCGAGIPWSGSFRGCWLLLYLWQFLQPLM